MAHVAYFGFTKLARLQYVYYILERYSKNKRTHDSELI